MIYIQFKGLQMQCLQEIEVVCTEYLGFCEKPWDSVKNI